MQIGMINDPAADPVAEAQWAADNGFEFLDLTMEGPAADVEHLDVAALRDVLSSSGLGIMGHTAWYLPFGSPVPQVRAGAIEAVRATLEPFATLGARYVNVHVHKGVSSFPYDDTLRWNAESFAALAELAQPYGITIMIENVVNNLNSAKAFRTMLDAHPDLRLHLDIAHASVKGDKTADFLKQHADRLVHVHVSDNRRVNDDHLPLGAGTVNWQEPIRLLRQRGYDSTITLEIFTPDRSFLLDSAARLRRWWNEIDATDRIDA